MKQIRKHLIIKINRIMNKYEENTTNEYFK